MTEYMENGASSAPVEETYKEKLLRSLKKEVKHIMEESVMLKCVHEDSASVSSLCASVDACLSYGLKRRALGLFKTRFVHTLESIMSLFSYFNFCVYKIINIVLSETSNNVYSNI